MRGADSERKAWLFYLGVVDFELSTKASLYGTSVWLNAWCAALLESSITTHVV